jgi:hypothetical protein
MQLRGPVLTGTSGPLLPSFVEEALKSRLSSIPARAVRVWATAPASGRKRSGDCRN